jgi:hypothetical protein
LGYIALAFGGKRREREAQGVNRIKLRVQEVVKCVFSYLVRDAEELKWIILTC